MACASFYHLSRYYYNLYSFLSELTMPLPPVTSLTIAEPFDDSAFFEYACDKCNAPVCERQTLIGLALGVEEETLCIRCLEAQQDLEQAVFLPKTKRYIQSRDCFKKPWNAVAEQAQNCPLLPLGQCPCQDL